jgi:hypothetical protein
MARKRMIDPGIWGSEDFNGISHDARLLWIGLFSSADDYGKGRANPAFLASSLFPYDELAAKDIEPLLSEIAKRMKILFYEVDGGKFYKLTAWKKWQKVDHPTPSTIPEPVANDSRAVREPFASNPEQLRELRELIEINKGNAIREPFAIGFGESGKAEIAEALESIREGLEKEPEF